MDGLLAAGNSEEGYRGRRIDVAGRIDRDDLEKRQCGPSALFPLTTLVRFAMSLPAKTPITAGNPLPQAPIVTHSVAVASHSNHTECPAAKKEMFSPPSFVAPTFERETSIGKLPLSTSRSLIGVRGEGALLPLPLTNV